MFFSTVSNLSQDTSDTSEGDQSNSDDNAMEDEEENTQNSDIEASDDSDAQRYVLSYIVDPLRTYCSCHGTGLVLKYLANLSLIRIDSCVPLVPNLLIG